MSGRNRLLTGFDESDRFSVYFRTPTPIVIKSSICLHDRFLFLTVAAVLGATPTEILNALVLFDKIDACVKRDSYDSLVLLVCLRLSVFSCRRVDIFASRRTVWAKHGIIEKELLAVEQSILSTTACCVWNRSENIPEMATQIILTFEWKSLQIRDRVLYIAMRIGCLFVVQEYPVVVMYVFNQPRMNH